LLQCVVASNLFAIDAGVWKQSLTIDLVQGGLDHTPMFHAVDVMNLDLQRGFSSLLLWFGSELFCGLAVRTIGQGPNDCLILGAFLFNERLDHLCQSGNAPSEGVHAMLVMQEMMTIVL
jgi:hypothetical protein